MSGEVQTVYVSRDIVCPSRCRLRMSVDRQYFSCDADYICQ